MANINPPPSVENVVTHPSTVSCEISDLLSELNRVIIEREKNNDENPTPGIDPAVLQQLQAVSSHMQTMNDCLSKTIWQMDNGFDGVHARMDGLSNRLDAIESGLKILISRSDEQASRESPEAKAAEKDAE